MARRQEKSQLSVARIAAQMFLDNGFAATSGSDIAEAVGVSERTIWRYFRTKESAIKPLFAESLRQYVKLFREWPRNQSLEERLSDGLGLENLTKEEIEDAYLIVRLIALLPDEPDLRSIWLLSYHEGEEEMISIIAERMDRSRSDFDVRLAAAAVLGAIRVIDETVSIAAIRHGQHFTNEEIVAQMSRAIRSVSNLPFCDPVVAKPFGDHGPVAGTR